MVEGFTITKGFSNGFDNDGGEGNTISDECPVDCPDINDDGIVNVSDLLIVIDNWGACE